jgi:3-hydroxy acid dehydrogenase/malonic semialdehyde reductase
VSRAVTALDGKSAVVTGASSGTGRATAAALVREGVRVVGGARRADRIEPPVTPLELDVMDPSSCERFVAAAVAELGGIDILVNGAGLALGRDPFDESTEEDERTVLETNVNGLVRITRLCLPHIRDGGHIVNLGSVAGRQAYPNGALYVTSKFAVRGFTYALREDLLGRPIRVTTVDAGLVQTEFSIVRFRGDVEAADKVYEGVEPLTAEDVTECILFALTRPLHVNVDEIVVKAIAQSSGARIVRAEGS